jgi:hypothetical protein
MMKCAVLLPVFSLPNTIYSQYSILAPLFPPSRGKSRQLGRCLCSGFRAPRPKHIGIDRAWSFVSASVQPIEMSNLPSLGTPQRTECSLTLVRTTTHEDRGNHLFSEEIRFGKIYSFKLKYFFNGGNKSRSLESFPMSPPFPNGAAAHFESITLANPRQRKES